MPVTFHKCGGVCPVCSKRYYEYGILLAGEPMQIKWSFYHFGSWGRSNAYCCTADHLAGPVATGSADWSVWQVFYAGGRYYLRRKRKELTLYKFRVGDYCDGQWFEEEGYYRKGPDGSFYRDERREHDEGYRIVV